MDGCNFLALKRNKNNVFILKFKSFHEITRENTAEANLFDSPYHLSVKVEILRLIKRASKQFFHKY